MKYIVAVSGGIDSVVLLDILSKSSDTLIIAHVDHGIRDDSARDAEFVRNLAASYGHKFEVIQLGLGGNASEEAARIARYDWLDTLRERYGASAVVTAHHQDDIIETIILNISRGTGWKGLCSLRSTSERYRPLLDMSRQEIVEYAINHELKWREDSTNDDLRYARNYTRHGIAARLPMVVRQHLLALYDDQLRLASEIETEVQATIPVVTTDQGYSRYALIMMPREVFDECIMAIVGQRLERKILSQLRHFVCTARVHKQYAWSGRRFTVDKRYLIVSTSDI